jgi:hypothetical protein
MEMKEKRRLGGILWWVGNSGIENLQGRHSMLHPHHD